MTLPKIKAEIFEDIGSHFGNQLRRLLIDTADTCRVAEIDSPLVARMLMGVLLCELVQGSDALKMNEREFLRACGEGRRMWIEAQEEEEPQHRTH